MEVVAVATSRHRQLIDLTEEIARRVAASGVAEGLCHLHVPHTTAAVLVNENADPAVGEDILAAFDAMLPALAWRHAEGNSDAHVLATLIGGSLVLPVAGRRLRLGRWQGIFFLELDGPRRRELWLSIGALVR